MSQMTIEHLPRKEIAVLRTMQRDGHVLTRIKELSEGDIEYVELPSWLHAVGAAGGAAGAAAMSDDDLLTCLHALEDRGLVTSTVSAHPTSATEYVCEWTICSNGRSMTRLELAGERAAGTFACGDVRVDVEARLAFAAGRRVTLTFCEFELLRTFVTHPGRAFTRDELRSEAPGAPPATLRSVDVHVMRLRKKLAPARLFVIETVPLVGYRSWTTVDAAVAAGAS
jgi:DNA-binding winged helix-turn-helix (wHTH) protein